MRLLFVIISTLFVSTLAVKGTAEVRGSTMIRRAVKEKNKDGAAVKEGKKKKDDKKKKKDGKKMKKDKTSKKCKKAKKAKEEPKTRVRLLQEDFQVDSAPVLAPSSLPYCLHGALSAQECQAVKQGKANKGDKSVKGDLNLDITRNKDISSEEVLDKVQDILRYKTSPEFLGCLDHRRYLLFGKEKESDEKEEEMGDLLPNAQDEQGGDLRVTGVDFANLVISENACESSPGRFSGKNCDSISTDVEIFFEGKDKPSKEEKQDMFDLLIVTIEEQAAAGAFSEVGTMEKVHSSESSGGSSAPIGIVVGVVAAAAAVVAGGFMYNKRRSVANRDAKGDDTSDSDEEPPVAEAQVVSVEDDGHGKKGKK